MLPLSRLILEGRGAIEAWDLHALLAAVDRARISARTPFRLFNDLMATDWIPREVKREFCRGLLACSPEASRLKERTEALRASMDVDPQRVLQYPRIWQDLIQRDLGQRIPVLKRHAVRPWRRTSASRSATSLRSSTSGPTGTPRAPTP